MPASTKNSVAANDLAVTKIARSKPTTQREWKIEGVPGLSIVVKPSGVATYYVRFQAGTGARRGNVRRAIGRASGPLAIKLAEQRPRPWMPAVAPGSDLPAWTTRRRSASSSTNSQRTTGLALFEP